MKEYHTRTTAYLTGANAGIAFIAVLADSLEPRQLAWACAGDDRQDDGQCGNDLGKTQNTQVQSFSSYHRRLIRKARNFMKPTAIIDMNYQHHAGPNEGIKLSECCATIFLSNACNATHPSTANS